MRGSEQTKEIRGFALFKISEGKLEEFKQLCADMMEIVRTNDSGTLEFAIYLNSDGSECVVYERYRDSEAVVEHGSHVGEIMQAIFATGEASSTMLGQPSAELTTMMADSPIPVFRPFLSM